MELERDMMNNKKLTLGDGWSWINWHEFYFVLSEKISRLSSY